MSTIVLDGHLTKSALACVRSLGKQGIVIACGATRKTAPACHSRYASSTFTYTSPKIDQKQFIADLIQQAKKMMESDGKKPVLFCLSDATSLSVAEASETLKEYINLSLPSREAVGIAADKAQTYTLARELSLPTIRTFAEHEFSDVVFPAVVKNRHSVVWKEGKAITGSAQFVSSQEELQQVYKDITEKTGEAPLVMEFIQGDEYGVEMVANKGEPIAVFVHKRIRSLSPRGGAAVVKETAEETQEVALMRAYALSLVQKLAWEGPIMVEFKVNAENGSVFLMEINGRFWGSLPLAIAAGVNFPLMMYELATEVTKKVEVTKPRSIRTRHFLGDCKWLLQVLFAYDPMRKYLYPSRLKALWDFTKEMFISKGDVFSWRDFKPSIMEYIDILSTWKSKA